MHAGLWLLFRRDLEHFKWFLFSSPLQAEEQKALTLKDRWHHGERVQSLPFMEVKVVGMGEGKHNCPSSPILSDWRKALGKCPIKTLLAVKGTVFLNSGVQSYNVTQDCY